MAPPFSPPVTVVLVEGGVAMIATRLDTRFRYLMLEFGRKIVPAPIKTFEERFR